MVLLLPPYAMSFQLASDRQSGDAICKLTENECLEYPLPPREYPEYPEYPRVPHPVSTPSTPYPRVPLVKLVCCRAPSLRLLNLDIEQAVLSRVHCESRRYLFASLAIRVVAASGAPKSFGSTWWCRHRH